VKGAPWFKGAATQPASPSCGKVCIAAEDRRAVHGLPTSSCPVVMRRSPSILYDALKDS